jgi:Flp pilus assembly protein TadG
MLGLTRSILRTLAAETRGAEIAEAAAVLPLMFMVLLGIFWFGQAFSIYGAITRAAQEGARAGAAPNCTTCSASTLAQDETNAVNAVTAAMVASKLAPTQTRYPASPPVFHACKGGSASCNATASLTNVCVQAPVQLATPAAGATAVCGISVSFQYPFQFWLPFTSLNKQKIWLSASARVRMENQ